MAIKKTKQSDRRMKQLCSTTSEIQVANKKELRGVMTRSPILPQVFRSFAAPAAKAASALGGALLRRVAKPKRHFPKSFAASAAKAASAGGRSDTFLNLSRPLPRKQLRPEAEATPLEGEFTSQRTEVVVKLFNSFASSWINKRRLVI